MTGIIRLLRAHAKRVALGLLVLLAIDAAQLVIPLLIRAVVDDIALGTATGRTILNFVLLIVGLGLFIAVFRFFWRYLLIGAARLVERDLRERIFAHAQRLDAPFYDRTNTGEVMALATNDLEAVRMAAGMGVVALADSVTYGVFSVSAMIYISPRLTLWTLLPMLVLPVITLVFGRELHRRFERVQAVFADMMEEVREVVSGMKVLKAYVQEDAAVGRFSGTNERFIEANVSLVKIWGFFFPMFSLFGGLGWAMLVAKGGAAAAVGDISVGDFVAFISYLGLIVWPLIAIGWVVNLYQRGSASLSRINTLLSARPTVADVPNAVPCPERVSLEVRGLSFSYSERRVLTDVSFRVAPGGSLGVVGTAGSGKTTLVSLLARIYDPPLETVTVGGVPLERIALVSWREAVGLVPQEAFLFSTTLRENIAFVNPDLPDERVFEAAETAGIASEIEAMEDGYDTVVGERGVTLSGGQKQRVALARALLKRPRVLVLDDTLSAVDADTEERILRNLAPFLKDRLSVIVSHRLTAVMGCDEIIFLSEGRVVERGTHDELVALGGRYALLWELQRLKPQVRA